MKFRLRALVLTALVCLAPGANAAELIKVKLAEVVRSQFYMAMYVALAKGFAKDEGLDVEMTNYNGGDRVGAALLSGQADFGLAGPEVAVYLYNGESPDKPIIFCSMTGTDGFFLASRKKIDNFQWSMLNGQKILGYRPGSTPELYFEYVMKQRGVDPTTIKSVITNIGPNARDGAWLSGAAEFGIFTEPNLDQQINAGNLHYVASIGKEVGRADYTVFMAKKSWVAAHPDIAQKWTNAVARGQQWIRTASNEEIADTVKAYFPGVTPEAAAAINDRYRTTGAPIWSDTTIVDKAGLAKEQEIMVSGGVLTADKVVPYDKFVDMQFAEKAEKIYGAGAKGAK
jgi:NitT/TauT family transport system substrate-binding protein